MLRLFANDYAAVMPVRRLAKTRCILPVIILISALFAIEPAPGLTAPVQAAPLTLNDALRLAIAHNPKIAAAKAQENSAYAALSTALAYPNPDVEFAKGASYMRQPAGKNGGNELVGLSQSIDFPYFRAARRKVAEAGITAGQAVASDTRLNQRTAVKQAFFDLLRRQAEARLASENHNLLMQIRNRVEIKVDVGESPRYELVKSEAEVLAAKSAVQSAEYRVAQARDRLKMLIGSNLPANFEVADEPLQKSELPELDDLRNELLGHQPLIRLANAEKSRAYARLELERALRVPQPSIRFSVDRDPEMSQWRVGVALPLPLWNRREGPIAEAVAGVKKAEADARQVHLVLISELEHAYSRYQIARSQTKAFESGLIKEAEKAMEVAEAAYRFGERGIIDYLDAQRVLRTARLDFLNARYELQSALIEIERLRAFSVREEK